MSISGIGNYSYANAYQNVSCTTNQKSQNVNSFSSVGTSSNFALHIGDENGEKALTAVTLANGGSASVFKAENYSDENPEYRIRYWNKSGEYKDVNVKIGDVNPENASYLEMLAYSTYSDVQGYTDNALGNFSSVASGVKCDNSYDENNVNIKYNFMSMVKELMEMQYRCNNLEGYLSYKQFYDYMSD
jgi:hypothetical protein